MEVLIGMIIGGTVVAIIGTDRLKRWTMGLLAVLRIPWPGGNDDGK